jgi:S-DNA-T family DNA segregation ATPase FtsK/SpoIIIE
VGCSTASRVELGLWSDVAEVFVGNDITDALDRLRELQAEIDARCAWLRRKRRRKIVRTDPVELIVVVIDEVAYYSATVGKKQDEEEFSRLLRDVVARGRAAGVIVIAATQRPSVDIIPTSLRDLFGYRMAFRCTTEIILEHGWAKSGYDASKIAPEDLGVGWLRAEGGVPIRIKSALLIDAQIYDLSTTPPGRDLTCRRTHTDDDPRLGQPLCVDCYDTPRRSSGTRPPPSCGGTPPSRSTGP